MTRILAIDLGLSTGWCLLDTEARIDRFDSGVWSLHLGQAHLRFLSLAELLDAAIPRTAPDLLAFEDVRFAGGGPDALISYGGLRGVLLVAAARRRLPYLGVTPAQVKKAAGLRASDGKPLVMKAARARWPAINFATHDEADARYVALAAAHHG